VTFKASNEVVWLCKVYIDIQFEAKLMHISYEIAKEFDIPTQTSGVL